MTTDATSRRDDERVPPARAREVVEIEDVERLDGPRRDDPRDREPTSWQRRAWRVAAPTVLGMLIDAGDVVMPFFLPLFPVGCLLGFLWSGYLDVPPTWRLTITVLTGLYLIAPFTAMVPAATVMSTVTGLELREPSLAR